MTADEEPNAHVVLATKLFRDCGFTLAAMQFPRPEAALVALKKANGLPADAKVPLAWGYFPNAYMRNNWWRYHKPETPHD